MGNTTDAKHVLMDQIMEETKAYDDSASHVSRDFNDTYIWIKNGNKLIKNVLVLNEIMLYRRYECKILFIKTLIYHHSLCPLN